MSEQELPIGHRNHALVLTEVGEGRVRVSGCCVGCERPQGLECEEERLLDWYFGELIQVALPDLTVCEAEWLVSGLCDRCWELIWDRRVA